MKSKSRSFLILALGVVMGVALSLSGSVFADRGGQGDAAAPLPLSELRTFAEVYAKVKQDYVEPVKDKTLIDNAISGMIAGLDPHSAFLDKQAFKDLEVGTTGQFGGLGIEVSMEDGFIKVISPIDGTPAAKAGIKPGDLIIRLDDTPVKGMTLNDAVKRMRGKPGTKIVLTVVREGAQKPLRITVTRAIIHVKSVKSRDLGDKIGYIRISSFQTQTGEQVHAALKKLLKANGGSLHGLVLDLRNNPGGVLGAAVSVADTFINKGLIVYTDGRTPDSKLKFSATPGDMLHGAPMVVLVNGGSASASEIVSGALQDHKRAIIMGSRTFGKGSVQTIFPMSNGTAVKLTTARYYTPSGRSIQNEGITPDITLKAVKVDVVQKVDNGDLIKERDLTHHLSNNTEPKGKGKSDGADAKEPSVASDYALHEAFNLLKGMYLLKEQQGAAK